MALDQAANFVAETLSASVTSTATTLPVTDASAYPDPANGEYNAVIWDGSSYATPSDDPEVEVVRVTGRDTTTDDLTVSRGQEGTTATTHVTGERVPVALTAKMIDDIETELSNAAISVSDDGTVVLGSASDLNFGTNVAVTDDGDGTVTIDATGTDTDTRIDVSDDGTLVLSEPTDVNFRTNLTVTDDGDGTVTVDATDTDTRTDVSDSATKVVSDVQDISFDANISVTDEGDGAVSVNATDTNTIPSASDNGTEVVADVLNFNFGSNLNVTSNDTSDEVTVDADTGGTTSGATLTTTRRYGLLGGN